MLEFNMRELALVTLRQNNLSNKNGVEVAKPALTKEIMKKKIDKELNKKSSNQSSEQFL